MHSVFEGVSLHSMLLGIRNISFGAKLNYINRPIVKLGEFNKAQASASAILLTKWKEIEKYF